MGDWLGTTRSWVVGFAAKVLTHVPAFFFALPAADLVAAADFVLGFLGPAFFLVAVTLDCDHASVAG